MYDYHLLITFVLLTFTFLFWWNVEPSQTGNLLVPAVGAVLGFSYFILKQHLEEARLFKDLYKEFNERYAKMNDRLYEIKNGPRTESLKSEEIAFLYSYFNLCAEEYLFYKKGFIYFEVWVAWQNGILIFCEDTRIRDLLISELETNSYYGLPFPTESKAP